MVLGSSSKYADYLIKDNVAISRRHAEIMYCEGNFFFIDLGSTNYSYIEGKKVEPFKTVKLEQGMLCTLADESFQFYIE